VQVIPHAPQFCGSVIKLAQRPLHVVCPAAQRTWQFPPTHDSPAAHARPHIPQCRSSVRVSTHSSTAAPLSLAPPSPPLTLIEHRVSVAAHTTSHVPREQTCPAAQARPHAPQLAGSLVVETHCPLHASCPIGHVG
jgi:hypothetical protein